MAMISEFKHKIGEIITLVHPTADHVQVMQVSTGLYFTPAPSGNPNKTIGDFIDGTPVDIAMATLFTAPATSVMLNSLPKDRLDLLMIYRDGADALLDQERHVFGQSVISTPHMCTIYGTLLDLSGMPMPGQEVKAVLNRAGYFTYNSGSIGQAAAAVTDEVGYFELPLVIGSDVTITIPIIGFTQRGFVPNSSATELTPQALLSNP